MQYQFHISSCCTLLTPVILGKLPEELQLLISHNVGDDELDLGILMKHVEGEVQAQDQTMAAKASHGAMRKPENKEPHTAAALLTGSSGNGPTCSYCRQSHLSNSCTVITQPKTGNTCCTELEDALYASAENKSVIPARLV